ncbi:MAG TPA: GNAT family N-acetyltransferase [Dermatophilaceae bacterium]|nr:GNAT family N-acetyltransferase [Dermatophilaceae bacterium]
MGPQQAGRWWVRPARPGDGDFLLDMTMEAVNWQPRRRLTRRQVMADPLLMHYSAGYPRPGDVGVVAVEEHDAPIGAAWVRCFPAADPGYGYVDDQVPELTVAVVPLRRGRGVGRALLAELLRRTAEQGYARVSLNVEDGNRARALYESFGFRPWGAPVDGGTVMVADLGAGLW